MTYQRSTDGGKTWEEVALSVLKAHLNREQIARVQAGQIVRKFSGYYDMRWGKGRMYKAEPMPALIETRG